MPLHLETLPGADALAASERLVRLYRTVFTAEPWNESEDAVTAFRQRLTADVHRAGFRAILAINQSGDVGFGTAWTTPTPFPQGRAYDAVRRTLGTDRVADVLERGTEVDELAVAPLAQGLGVGAALLDALADGAAHRRCWLLTWRRAPGAVRFYENRGWHQIAPTDAEDGLAVFLAPHHPGAASRRHPLL